MKSNFFRFLATLCVVASPSTWAGPATRHLGHRCGGGGEGPKPLTTVGYDLPLKNYNTAGGVHEFLFWEKRNAVIYRSDADSLNYMPLESEISTPMSAMGLPLSRVVSAGFRFFAVAGEPWVFDGAQGQWHQYAIGHRGLKHLFWDRDVLHSVATFRDAKGVSTHQFYRYQVGQPSAVATCQFRGAALGQGHRFPHAFFYSATRVEEGQRLVIHEFDVRKCRVITDIEFNEPIIGPVLDVHRFADLDANLVSVDHPKSNILWHMASEGCNYYWVPGGKPMVMNPKLAIIGAFSSERGLNVVYLRKEKIAPVLTELPLLDVTQDDLWLTDKADRLFVTPRLSGKNEGKPFLMAPLSGVR